MSQDHDGSYKDVFSHPEMVRDLLLQFVPVEWSAFLDLETLERVNASYVSESGRARHGDMVWKLRARTGAWLYVYVLLEFQSEPDRWMALRLLVYVGLLYQDLVKRGEYSPDGKLPPVMPIVLYNGTPRWTAATDLADLLMPSPDGLERYQPGQRYLLIEENALNPEALGRDNLAAMLFQLEHSRSLDDLRKVFVYLMAWVDDEKQAPLRRSLTRWLRRQLRRKIENASIPDVNDWLEMDNMLAERIDTWAKEWEHQGLEKGLREGRQEGRIEGEVRVLRRLLARRFPHLPDWIESRLAGATEIDLLRWSDAVLDAPTLEEIFAR